MGLSKQYLRYLPLAQFGVIASGRSNALFIPFRNTTGRYVACGSCEHVNIWDVKTGKKVLVLKGDKSVVTVLDRSPDGQHLAVGYLDGTIRAFSTITSELLVTYSGHRSGVSCLSYDKDGMRLASGANDAEVIVWDLVNESGLYKFKGHKDQVTCCHFVANKNMLITSSKDTFIKFWDLDTQHCFKTMVGHRAEVWNFICTPRDDIIISGSSDSALRVWALEYKNSDAPPVKKSKLDEDAIADDEEQIGDTSVVSKKFGSLMREDTDRVVSLRMSQDGRLIVCHGVGKNIELFKVRTEDEIRSYLKKKAKKMKKRNEASEKNTQNDQEFEQKEETCDDKFVHIGRFRTPGKVRSIDVIKDGDEYLILCLLANNQIIIKSTSLKLRQSDLPVVAKVFSSGHRNPCRQACFTSDGLALLTASSNSVKMWNRVSQQCIQTCETDKAAACLFAPGDKQFLVGTMTGMLEIHDVPSGTCTERVEAHSEAVTSLALYSNKHGVATSSKDRTVKFWDFDLVLDEKFSSSAKRLSLSHSRTLQLDEEINVIEFSQDGKLLACALLNCSVKIFYVDSLKFFLSLYGHSLPVTCLSMTSDCSIIATGSSDRNIKFWGLDFGDCHKSIFAHDDSVTSVHFIPDTHLLFSAGKDGRIKQWDGDKFIHIQTLLGHHGSISHLTLDPRGDYLASSGTDMSVRYWSRSNEIVIPDEEHEREREEEDEKRLVKNLTPTAVPEEEAEESTTRVSKPTIEAVKGAEKIMEALELHRDEGSKQKQTDNKNAQPTHPILLAYGGISSDRYVLEVLKKVKSSELEESLLVLPFSYIPDLLKLLNNFVSCSWEVELSCRCLLFLLKVHHKLISSSKKLLPVLENLQNNTESGVQKLQDTIGFNLAYLSHLKRQMEAKSEVTFFEDATDRFQQKKKKQKKKLQHAILTV